MVDISRMARAAGIGSAVGATIGGFKESVKAAHDKDGDILGGIVGGALVGSIGGAGISAAKQILDAKKLASGVSDQVVENATNIGTINAKSEVSNNIKDLNVAKNVMDFKVGDSSISISKYKHLKTKVLFID
jgi:hypothetical protein